MVLFFKKLDYWTKMQGLLFSRVSNNQLTTIFKSLNVFL